MKYVILIIQVSLLLLTMEACEKNDSGVPGLENNGFRVKKITGFNELWQDYTMECAYKNERLDSAVVYHHNKSVKSILYMRYKTDATEAEIQDIVPMVDKDSMAKLNPDSIPYSMQTAMLINFTFDAGNRIKSQDIEYWRPKNQDTDGEYVYSYEMKESIKFLYEYAENGQLVIWRSPNYLKDARKAKCEYTREGEKVVQSVLFNYEGADWTPAQTEKFTYFGSQLMTWEVLNGIKAQYTWGGNQLEHVSFSGVQNSAGFRFQYDSNGLVTKIMDGNGEVEEITYEIGVGNFSWFSLPLEAVYQIPSGLGCLGKSTYIPFYER